jgi:hypothetical protein
MYPSICQASHRPSPAPSRAGGVAWNLGFGHVGYSGQREVDQAGYWGLRYGYGYGRVGISGIECRNHFMPFEITANFAI